MNERDIIIIDETPLMADAVRVPKPAQLSSWGRLPVARQIKRLEREYETRAPLLRNYAMLTAALGDAEPFYASGFVDGVPVFVAVSGDGCRAAYAPMVSPAYDHEED